MNNIDISIIVPIYNAEKYIEKCINSLINQTKKELEFILVNDGSTDNTEKVIKSYNDKRIKYFKNKNQGIGKTRNFGIDKSTGKYLMFVDSDDYIREDACELLFNKINKDNLDLVVCDYYKVYEKDNKIVEERLISFNDSSLKDNTSILTGINMSPWNKIYSSKLVKDNNLKFIEDLKYEDTPFVCEALDKSKKIGKIDECLNYYVIHGNSETTVRDEKNKNYLKEELDKLTVKILTNYTIQQREQKDRRIGLRFINEAFKYLEKEVPDYKDDKYYENRGTLRKTIEKSKFLSKLYCKLYIDFDKYK